MKDKSKLETKIMNSILDVQVIHLTRYSDDRGFFSEVYRQSRNPLESDSGLQLSYTETFPDVIKAFHYHQKQYDYWFCPKGNIKVGLVDIRKESLSRGKNMTIYIGEDQPKAILIPPGVAHGYKVLGKKKAGLFYLTSEEYNPADPDELRLPWDHFDDFNWETENR